MSSFFVYQPGMLNTPTGTVFAAISPLDSQSLLRVRSLVYYFRIIELGTNTSIVLLPTLFHCLAMQMDDTSIFIAYTWYHLQPF